MPPHPTALGHVHLKVRDVDRAVEFYADALGLSVRERTGRFAFLTYGDVHHDIALQGVAEEPDAPDAERPPGPGVGLYHVAVECPDRESLAATYERLRERGVAVSPVDHGISRALYFDDPAGNGLEVYVDTRERADEEWAGRNAPFDPLADEEQG